MRQLVLVLLAVPWIASCVQRDNSTSVDSNTQVAEPVGSITNFKVGDRQFDFTVSTERGPRFVTTMVRGSRITAAIQGTEGQTLFELAVEFDGETMLVSETAGSDRLSIRHTQGLREIRERFVLNGRELAVVYPKLDHATMSKSSRLYRRGEHERIHPQLLRAFRDFDEFYRTDNALHWNPDGETLVAALLSQELSEKLHTAASSKTTGGNDVETARERKEMVLWCATVSVGTGLKCFFGGAANPLCLIGTAHSIACGIYEIVCALWTC